MGGITKQFWKSGLTKPLIANKKPANKVEAPFAGF